MRACEDERILPPVHFHLPGSMTDQFRAPDHSGLLILQRDKGEELPDGHGPILSKAKQAMRVSEPATFQVKVLQGLGIQAPFQTPCRPQTVKHQTVRRIILRKGGQSIDGKTGEVLEHHGFRAMVLHPAAAAETGLSMHGGDLVKRLDSTGVSQTGQHPDGAVILLHLLVQQC